MAVRDYSGFQAIVNSVEKLRETVDREADKQLTIFRVIRDDQRLQLTALERMVEGLKSRSQTRNNFGFPDRLELKNVRLETRFVSLSARSVIVETKGGLSREKQSKTDSQELAKALGSEIKKIKVGGGLGNPLQIFGAGILLQFGAQFAKGFEQSFGKKTGFTFQGTGQAAGDVTANSLKTVQSLLNDLVDTLETKINQITGRDKPIGERILTASETLQKIQSKLGVSNNNPYAQKAVNNSITSFQNMLNVFGSGEYSKFFEASQKAVSSLTELLGLISSENDLGEFAQDLGELLKIAIAFNGDEFSQIIKQSHSLLTTQKTLEGSSAELIGSLKQALSEQKIIEQGFRLVAKENHKSFFVNDQGKYIGTSNVGGRVLGFTATPQQAMPGVEQTVYDVAFSLDSQFSSLGQAAELTKKELIDLKTSVAEFFNKFVKSVDDAVLTATPENADQKGGRRASIYKRFGFVSEGEGNRLVAQVASGNVVKPDLQFNLKENEQVIKISEQIEKRLTATLKTFDDLFQENIKQAIEYAKSIIVGSELIKQDLEQLEKEAKNVGYDQSPAIQAQNRIRQNLKNLQARINQSKRLQSDLTLQNFSKVDLTKRNDPSSKEKLAQIALGIVKFTKDAPIEISDKLLERVLQLQKQETKPNEPNQVPTRTDTPGRPDGSGNQPPDRTPDIVPVGPVELPIGPRNNVDTQADPTRGGGLAPLAGQLDTYQKTLRESLARVLEAQKAQTEIEIEPGFWVDVEQLNQGFVKRTQTQLILFWEKLRTNLGKEINRTLAGLLGTIPGAMLGRGLTGDPVGGYLGGMAGRLIAETGFQDVSNFRSLQQQGMSPATAEFWQQFGNNRKFLPNTLRKTAVGYVTGSVVGRGINDVMQATGANQLIGALMPSWLETAIGDGINRTIKTIADPNIDLAIPNLPPAANKILSAPLHAVGKSVAAQGFLGNVATSFLDHQTKTALMPVRQALTGAGQALGGEGLLGEYLGDRFTGLGIGAIQDTAKASGRGVAGMIAPGLPAEVRNFIADQVIKQGVLDGTVRDQVAPFLASRAGTDVFARGVKVPVTGKIAGTINQTLDKYDPFAIAPKQLLTDEQILLNRQQRLAKKRTTAINAVENLFNRIDKSVDETTKAVVGIGNGFLGFFDNIRNKTYDFAKKTAGLTDNPITLIDQYIVYLDQLVQDAQKQAEETVKGIIPDYKNLTIPERKEAIGSYKEKVATEVKKFRMAIEDGESQIALEIGENVLTLVESTRKVYKDLLEAVPSDLSGTKSIQANQRYLTSVQTEVLKGQPNLKGRAKTGLMQLVGTETSEGFIKGIEERLNKARNSGKELAESAIEGAKKRLGIASPSRVFEEIGQRVVEGFNLGVKAIQSAINTPIDQALTAVDNTFSAFIGNAQQGFNDFVAQLEQDFPIFAELKDLILGLAAGFVLNNIFELLVGQITALGDASFDAVLELESMRLALTSVTGSAEAGAKGLAFVREEAQRLGVELKTAEEAYTGFLAVTKYTVLQGKQADRIFSIFQETAARRGLSNEEQGRMFAAINQAISKRKLSAEEVRGQLGEIPGLAFESTVARSMGVNPGQLSEMMGDGLLMAEDVFPKVAALYEAENAKIAEGTETTTQALTRFQNAIVNLQRSFEGWIAPAKIFFNFFAAAIEKISEIIPIVVRYLGIFSAALFIDFAKISINLIKFLSSLKTVQVVLQGLAKVAVAAFKLLYKELLIFLGQFALLTLAVDAVGAAIYVLSNNAFPELKKGIEEATTRANQLEQALQNVGKATQAIPKELPKTEEEIVTTRNWNILGWDTGFNLEGTRQFLNNIDKAVGFEALGFEPALTTLGQQELANFQENVGGLVSQVDKNLSKQFDVEKTIKEIRELDKELTQARSRQFNIPAGDKKRYEAAIKEQQKLIEERDKKLSATASFEKALQGDKAEIEEYLKALDELVAKRGITEEAEKSIRAQLEQRLKDIDKTSTAFDDLMSNLQKSVNALTLALRTLNEQAAYFNETLQRNATNARVQFIRRARAAGVGSQVRDLGLDSIEQNTLEARIVFLRDQLGAVNEYLSKPDFADVLTELRQQAADMGVNLENTATIDRLISENRSQQETAVLNTLKEQLRLQDELGQAEENLEQSISSTRSAITDLNNSVEEFFFNLTQRIDEAIVEVDRILNKLKYTDIKNRLQRALVPGSNTFVNGLVNQIQGIFDRASGIVEQLLGQRSARINFVGERRGLQVELENFTRNLGGATEALELFRQGLLGTQPSGGGGQPSASGRFSLGKIGSTGIGTGSHLDIRGRDAKGNIMSEARLREFFSQVYVDGKSLSEQLNKITSGYGIRRPPTRGASREHYAFDFGFPKGTPLEFRGAASSARSFFTRGNGNTVELTLPTGEKLLFLHLDSVADLGTIQRGRVNMKNGNTGTDSGLEARLNRLLKKYNAPLTAKDFMDVSQQTGVSIDALVTQALIESHFGTKGRAVKTRNPLNYGNDDAGNNKFFSSFREGLLFAAQKLKEDFFFSTPEDFINRGFMGRYGIYATDPAYKRKYQSALQRVRSEIGSNQPLSPTAPIPNVNNAAAQGLTNRLIQIKENQVNLGDAGVRQEIEAFLIELQQTQQDILRQMGDSIRQSTQSVIDAQNSLQDIRSQYSPQTQSAQVETELRGVENQFRDLDNQLFEQERGLTDNIQGLDNLLGQMKPILEILSASTNQVDKESASFLMGLIGRLEQDKATYSGMRSEIQQLRGQLKEGKLDAENFVRAQAKLRTIQSDLERIGTELSIAQEQNNLEQERAIALLQSRQQLELDLLQIAQDFEGEDRDKRLALAKEQARLREREIEYQFQSKSLSQEIELISQRLAIAQSLSNLGKINELELLQSQKQLEQEIFEIKKQYPDLADQELRINLAKEQARLREIGIENNYNNQRWQRQQELFDMESRITEARATRLERSGQPFEAAAMREELAFRAELLRYEQEIEAIRQRYTDPADEQTRDELIRNAGILLELNLEQIDQQFKDLGETIRDTASGAFATFLEDTLTGTKSIGDAFLDMAQSILKSLAQIAARMAIGGIFRLLKLPILGFADGGTIPNFAEGDTVKSAKVANLPFGNAQGNPFKGIQEALRKEGPQGVLAVFTPGEEILSLRTGEAQRYQRLKTQLGKNPLAKIGNFADGGTIGINESLLAGLNYGMPTASRLPNNFGQTTQVSNYGGDRSVTVNVTAPNPSAFNASERQIARTIAEYLSRV